MTVVLPERLLLSREGRLLSASKAVRALGFGRLSVVLALFFRFRTVRLEADGPRTST